MGFQLVGVFLHANNRSGGGGAFNGLLTGITQRDKPGGDDLIYAQGQNAAVIKLDQVTLFVNFRAERFGDKGRIGGDFFGGIGIVINGEKLGVGLVGEFLKAGATGDQIINATNFGEHQSAGLLGG